MRIGYIPSPRTPEGEPAQPMTDDPPRERRITEDEARFAAEHGLRDLEIDRWSWPEGAFVERERELELLEEYDLNVPCVGLWGQGYMDDESGETGAALDRALDYADDVDADVFVTGTEVPTDLSEAEAWDEGIAFYGDLVDRIRSRGFEPAFYFGHGTRPLVRDLGDIRRFADALPNASFKVDGANLLLAGLDPTRVLEEIADRVGHFHVKDAIVRETADGVESSDQCPAGLGDVPWGNVIDLLYIGGYDGVLSIEPHGEYWGHRADDGTRRQGIRIAAEHIARRLKPADRPGGGRERP